MNNDEEGFSFSIFIEVIQNYTTQQCTLYEWRGYLCIGKIRKLRYILVNSFGIFNTKKKFYTTPIVMRSTIINMLIKLK